MAGLLKPGFHSGTIPKAYAKLRRATWRGAGSALAHREALHHVEEAIRRFVERELIALLEESPRWTPHVEVGHIEIASNRVRIELGCAALQEDGTPSVKIAFEEQSGWLLGSVAQRGWIAKLDEEQLTVLENGLDGFYKLAAVDMVRERIEAELAPDGDAPPYDVADEGIVVWPDGTYKTEVVHRVTSRFSFRDVRIEWKTWAEAWGAVAKGRARRILSGPSILPVTR